MQDIVARVPTLSFIDIADVLVFARSGRSNAEGAFATCHCLEPAAERARLLLLARSRDRPHHAALGMVRHQVAGRHDRHAADEIPDLVRAAALLRSVARSIAQGALLSGRANRGWPSSTRSCTSCITSIRSTTASGGSSARTAPTRPTATARGSSSRSPTWSDRISTSRPDPAVYDFLRHDFAALESRHGGVVGTSFRTFPSFPQRYIERLAQQLPSESDAADVEDRTAAAAAAADALHAKTICTSGSSRSGDVAAARPQRRSSGRRRSTSAAARRDSASPSSWR